MENAVKTIHFWKSRSTLLEVTFHTFGKNLGGSCEVRSKLGALGAFGGLVPGQRGLALAHLLALSEGQRVGAPTL